MDEKLFECSICLQTCKRCVNCSKCHHIMCKAHVRRLPRRACPICRDSPFRFEENVALQRIIDEFRTRIGAPPFGDIPSDADDGHDDGGSSQYESDDGDPAPPMDVEGVVVLPPAVLAPEQVAPLFGRKEPRPGFDGHFRKLPSDVHDASMREHARTCAHRGCRHVWKGPWGSFIGGTQGRTHFDLTPCPEGKRLNWLIGWDYENPPC
eukprot:TRINITY_DN30048_c0_g1_i1.p1 TRINITY_DN30048_c0_g1~~TRINITY_DN30048_c0_g1_i1.p1  ORF type:complete len:208 (-),score=15.39 TRINITY_DN30048_c0_g1_i1:151-774(-)